jgi:aspartyl-tRNA(Asn)/glutamyl-tRNA(Gln) amidotransferase subunit A
MKPDIIYSDAIELADLIRTRQISPVEVMQAHLDRIEALNPRINAVVTIADGAIDAARIAEAAVMAGENLPRCMVCPSRSKIPSTPLA